MMRKRSVGLACILVMVSVLWVYAQDDADDPWQPFREADVANVPEDWSTPMRIGANHSNYWEDSPFITGDGETIYFMVYPDADLYTAIASGAGEFVDDIDIYQTHFPFETRELDTRYFLSTDLTSSAGPMVTQEGDVFYHTNHQGMQDGLFDDDIYLNDEWLAFNTDEPYTNPHYCIAKDELWFDLADTKIYILYKARDNDFAGEPELAPSPINTPDDEIQDFQPWLSKDCQRLYFTSNRDGMVAIYRAERLDQDEWTEPELVVWSQLAVGEPTLTDDEKTLVFIQVFANDEGNFTTDIFMTTLVDE